MKKLVSGIVVALAVAGCGSSGGGGSITFDPSTESCSNPVAWTETVTLPSSVKAADSISLTLDGKQLTSGTVGASFTQKADGSWTEISQVNAADMRSGCATQGLGNHTEQVLDSSGRVLAHGSFTVTQ